MMDSHIAQQIATRISTAFIAEANSVNTYNNQLACEALLLLSTYIPNAEKHVASVIETNGTTTKTQLRWQDQQFHDLSYAWFAHTGQCEEQRAAYLKTTDSWISETARRPNGSIIHNCTHNPIGSLLDMLQAYCIRLARAAAFSKDSRYITELLAQLKVHREELRNPQSGCYHQGKGWLANDGLSPCCWSRGQGWLLHGLVQCLPLLRDWPEAHAYVMNITCELLDALLPLQGPSGLWHQLIDEPLASFPDSSGSALILEAYILMSAECELHTCLKIPAYIPCIEKAWQGLAACVDADGIVDQACKGPGTIWEDGPWRNTQAPKGDPHGVFSMLFACAAILQNN